MGWGSGDARHLICKFSPTCCPALEWYAIWPKFVGHSAPDFARAADFRFVMMMLYLHSGEHVEIIRAMKLEQGYSLLLARDEEGEHVALYSAEEIERIEEEDDEADEPALKKAS